MTSRLASLASLASLLVVVSACSSIEDGDYTLDASAGAGGGDVPGKGEGGGGSDDQPTETGGSRNGTAGSSIGVTTGGAAGDTGDGTGGANGESAACPEDTNASGGIDCKDLGQSCAEVCAGAQPIYEGLPCREFVLTGRPVGLQPACALQASVGPSMAFAFAAPSAGWARFTVTPKVGDVIVSATTAGCDKVTSVSKASVCRNEVGGGGVESVLVPVKDKQTVTLLVTGATAQDASARFDVETTFVAAGCGNGLLDEGEACDDGKTKKVCGTDCKSFLGCQDATALADVSGSSLEASVATAQLGGDAGVSLSSCVTVGATVERTIYALRAANTGRLEARLVSPKGADLALSVRSSCGDDQEVGCSDRVGAVSGETEERLSLPATAGQTYYLVVEGYGASGAGYTLSARTLPVECGDGIVAPSVEQCDPGGGVTADATCEETCTRTSVGDVLDAQAPVTITSEKPAEARIHPAGDVDEYLLTAAGPVTVSVAGVNGSDCQDGKLDSQLTVLDLQGHVVGFNDDAEAGSGVAGYCSEVKLPKGSYRVRVRSSEASAPAQVFSYRVRVAKTL